MKPDRRDIERRADLRRIKSWCDGRALAATDAIARTAWGVHAGTICELLQHDDDLFRTDRVDLVRRLRTAWSDIANVARDRRAERTAGAECELDKLKGFLDRIQQEAEALKDADQSTGREA